METAPLPAVPPSISPLPPPPPHVASPPSLPALGQPLTFFSLPASPRPVSAPAALPSPLPAPLSPAGLLSPLAQPVTATVTPTGPAPASLPSAVGVPRALSPNPAPTLLIERRTERIQERTTVAIVRDPALNLVPSISHPAKPESSARSLAPHPTPALIVPAAPSPEAPAPTIRVTIGRVDIRAIRPPSAPATAPRLQPERSPVVSLENYLAKRNSA